MHSDSKNLIAAVSKAIGHDLDVDAFDDRLTLQKGCYILNSWGYGPRYNFGLYVRGPYSSDLADDYYEIKDLIPDSTTIPNETIDKLAEIFDKGLEYAEAYATVLLVKNNSPGAPSESIRKRAMELKPRLKKEVKEASKCLLV